MAYSDMPDELKPRAALFEAIAAGDVAAIGTLLDSQPALVDAPNDAGYTPLRRAAMLGRLGVVKFLLARGANAPVGGPVFDAALASSVHNDQPAVAMFLIRQGVDINKPFARGETLLHKAAAASRGLAEALVGLGADPNVMDKRGMTPMLRAVKAGHVDTAEALLRGGAACDVNSAAALGRVDDLAAWIKAVPDAVAGFTDDSFEWTPLNFAAIHGQSDAIRFLVSHGADVNDIGKAGDTSLHRAAAHGALRSIATLLACGADVNATDFRGRTPLHWAATDNQAAAVECLLGFGADASAETENGTPADEAEEAGHDNLAAVLRAAAGTRGD